MTTHTLKALLLTTLAAASTGAFAAESADLAVRGTIRPSACNVQLSGGGLLDLGTISATTLSETAGTQIADSPMTMTVSCDAATLFGISTVDNRAGTLGASARAAAGISGLHMAGLGTVNGTTLGGYHVRFLVNGVTGDGATVKVIYSNSSGASWVDPGPQAGAWGIYMQPGTRLHSYAAADGSTPVALSNLVQPLSVRTFINSTETLPALTGGVPIDGSLTFQIQYL